MKLAYFHTGLHLILNEIPYVIIKIIESGECYLERKSDAAVVVRSKSELIKAFVEDNLTIDSGRSTNTKVLDMKVDLAGLNESERKSVLRKKHYIKIACGLLGNTPTKLMLAKAIDTAAKVIDDNNPPGTSTVYRWWKKWIENGKDILCLLNKNSGPKKPWKLKGIVSVEIEEVINNIYLTRQKNSGQAAYDALIAKLDSINFLRDKPLNIPSRSSFYRILDKLDKYEVLASREGKRTADNQYKAVGLGVNPINILERVEVDHTPMDIMIFNPITGKPDGRPNLTILLDRYSRMPLGFEVGFEPPSGLSVVRALRNSILPKTQISKEYPDIKNEWIAYGIMITLICDNGSEFHDTQLKRICWELNIDLQFCPKGEPSFKGGVERFLGTANRQICHRIPGTTFSNIKQRGNYDSIKQARITLSDLKELITEWIVDIYCQSTHKVTQRTPHNMWLEGLKRVEPTLPESKEKLELILTSEDERVLTEKGIEFKGLFYNSSELGIIRRFKRPSNKVKFRFDKENMSFIWVFDEFNGNYLKVYCIDADYADGLSLRQHMQIRQEAREHGKSDQDTKSLMHSKELFRKKIEKKSCHKLLRERKKAARDNSDSLKSNNLIPTEYASFVEDDWDLQDVPNFQVTKKGAEDE